jgi:carbonic anhydrase
MGRLQSPLNLQDTNSKFNSTINTIYYDYTPIQSASLGWSADGRILKVQTTQAPVLNNFGYLGLSRGGVIKQYALKRIEFNIPAEHQIEGVNYDLEVRFIHEKVLPFQTNVNQYRRISDGNRNLVISILYSVNANLTDNGFLKSLAATWNAVYNPDYVQPSFTLDLNSFDLFRERRWFFYEGSFTSFPCDETVNNIVIRDPYMINDLTLFQTIYQTVYDSAVISKPVNDFYGRAIYRNYMNLTEIASGKLISTNLLCLLAFILIAILI